MIVFPNAKINIGLNVIEKRPDGFHNIESCFVPIPWKDALEVIEADSFSFKSTGVSIPGESNIVINAYNLLKEAFGLPPVAIHLHKNIPIGAGLGGGSADGAFMLTLLNNLFGLNLDLEQLKSLAGQLGSDCPFFIENKNSYVEGTGNIFSEIKLDLSDLYLAVIYPEIHVETKSAYQGLIPQKPSHNLKEVIEMTMLSEWQDIIKNDFENTASPEILKIKEDLYSAGALYASMSGSGSSVYGLFIKKPDIDKISGFKLVSIL